MDHGVLQWVQQRNVEGIIKRAAAEANSDPAAAAKTLRLAQNLTRKLGNSNMTKVLDKALDELQTNKTISFGHGQDDADGVEDPDAARDGFGGTTVLGGNPQAGRGLSGDCG